MNILIGLIAAIVVLMPAGIVTAAAENNVSQSDRDGDGGIDRIMQYDPGGLPLRLQADTNRDGRMDVIQHYRQGEMVRNEKDTDHDGDIDLVEHYQQTRRTKLEYIDRDRRPTKVVLLDTMGRARQIRQDTAGNGILDTQYNYVDGQLQSMTIDADANGHPEIRIRYQDPQTFRQEEDQNQDGRVEVITYFRDDRIHRQEEDTNFDGKPDRHTYYDTSGHPSRVELDSGHAGRIDRIDHFANGILAVTEEDLDGDSYRETRSHYSSGRIISRSQDRNGDGKPDFTTRFNARGMPQTVEIDENLDGRTDTWQFYSNNLLERLECDEDRDGRIDLKVKYAGGKRLRSEQDLNGNGYFERIQKYDPAEESAVVEIDTDENKICDQRYYIHREVVRKKEYDQDQNGAPDLIEYYNETAMLVRSEEAPAKSGRMTMVRHFDAQGEPQRAERDADHDGKTDTWYFYTKGRLFKVEEDTNGDGRPDLWEKYDAAERLTWRARDLDHDGSADIEDRPETTTDQKQRQRKDGEIK